MSESVLPRLLPIDSGSCRFADAAWIEALVAGAAPRGACAEIETHLALCDECRTLLAGSIRTAARLERHAHRQRRAAWLAALGAALLRSGIAGSASWDRFELRPVG